jgi:hypothetical protein
MVRIVVQQVAAGSVPAASAAEVYLNGCQVETIGNGMQMGVLLGVPYSRSGVWQ